MKTLATDTIRYGSLLLVASLCAACTDSADSADSAGSVDAVDLADSTAANEAGWLQLDQQLALALARASACVHRPMVLGDAALVVGYPYQAVSVGGQGADAVGSEFGVGGSQACVVEAATCEEVRQCLHLTGEACDPDTLRIGCGDNGDLLYCLPTTTGGVEARRSCSGSPHGDTCIGTAGVYSACGVGTCDPIAVGGWSECDGDDRRRCHRGVEWRHRCAASNQLCVERESASATAASCVDSLSECTGEDECSGTVHRWCLSGGTRDVDCAALAQGSKCKGEKTFSEICQVADPVCEHGDVGCDGDAARICVFGGWVDFDCAAWGATCVTGIDGTTGIPTLDTPYVACTPR